MSKSKEVEEKFKDTERLLVLGENFVVLDIETSGFSPNKGGRIIEIGAVKLEKGVIVDRFNELINPELKITKKITELTGITNDMVANAPVYREVLPKLYSFIGDSVVVCHNKSFDWDRYLLHYFKNVGIVPNNDTIDTLLLARQYLPGRKEYKLKSLCDELNITLVDAHRAVNDAEATAHMLLAFKSKFSNQLSIFEAIPKEKPVEQIPVITNTIRVRRVRRWEKEAKGNQPELKRLYVSLNVGVVYFDISTLSWGVKQLEVDSIDLEAVKNIVLDYLKLPNEQALCSYTG